MSVHFLTLLLFPFIHVNFFINTVFCFTLHSNLHSQSFPTSPPLHRPQHLHLCNTVNPPEWLFVLDGLNLNMKALQFLQTSGTTHPTILTNIRNYTPNDKVSLPRRLESSTHFGCKSSCVNCHKNHLTIHYCIVSANIRVPKP